MSEMYAVDAEYIKPDKSLTMGSQFQVKEEKRHKTIRLQYYSNKMTNSRRSYCAITKYL